MTSTAWAAVCTAVFFILVLIVAVWRLMQQLKAEKRMRLEQEAQRDTARAEAQNALNALYETARGIMGVHATAVRQRTFAAVELLDFDDWHGRVEKRVPKNHSNFFDAADEYAGIMDGRSVVDGNVAVYPDDIPADSYTTAQYRDLANAAKTLATTVNKLRDVPAKLTALCIEVEQLVVLVPHRRTVLTERANATSTKIDAIARQGYQVKVMRHRLGLARGWLTKAATEISMRGFFTAQDYLTEAEKWLDKANEMCETMPGLESEIEQRLAGIEAVIADAHACVAKAKNDASPLLRTYAASVTRELREEIKRVERLATRLSEHRDEARAHLAALDIHAAKHSLAHFEIALNAIRAVVEQAPVLSKKLADSREDCNTLRSKVRAELGALQASLRERRGTQITFSREAEQIAALIEGTVQKQRRDPDTALKQLQSAREKIPVCAARSLKEHERANGSGK